MVAAWGLSNGLGNAGDRIALFLASGEIIDALSYGSDATYDRPPLPAPGAGKSLVRRFADDGSFVRAEVSSSVSPGRIAYAEPEQPSPSVSAPAPTALGVDPLAWGALTLIGTGVLGAAAVQRYRVVRGRG